MAKPIKETMENVVDINQAKAIAEVKPKTEVIEFSQFRADLEKWKAEDAALVFDLTTSKGIKEARSHIYTLRTKKSAVEQVRKLAKEDALKYGRQVDATAAAITDEIEAIITARNAPLVEMEQREAARVAEIELRLAALDEWRALPVTTTAAQWNTALELVGAFSIDASLCEFQSRAMYMMAEAITEISERRDLQQKNEDNQAELVRLRAETEERLKREREEQIAKDAAAEATRKAEAAAFAEKNAAAARERELQDAAEKQAAALKDAEKAKTEAVERAQKAEAEAKKKAEQAVLQKQAEEKAAEEKREANKKHCAKINNEAVNDLVNCGIPFDMAKAAVVAIAQKKIKNVSIQY